MSSEGLEDERLNIVIFVVDEGKKLEGFERADGLERVGRWRIPAQETSEYQLRRLKNDENDRIYREPTDDYTEMV